MSSISDKIQQQIQDNRIMLYMKGTPQFPMCGFSNAVVETLNSYDVVYGSANVLEDDELRQGIKAFSDWPTLPQLYVDGEFVGGCDIVLELHQTGQLKDILAGS